MARQRSTVSKRFATATAKKECAFCPNTAKLSAEHLWSDWMNDLFPGEKRFTRRNEKGEVVGTWRSDVLDWKARVVCERCNTTWMSQIESGHAQPALTDLILGKLDIPFTQARAASLALFAFKSGVIFDHIRRDRPPFFDRNSRHAFRESLTIPERVNMWMAGFAPMGRGEVFSMYHTGTMPNGAGLEMYVCTYSIGHFVFQVGAVRNDVQTFSPQSEGFDYLSVPFWPRLPDKLLWPLGDVLRSADQLQAFAERWRDVRVWI